MKKILITTSLIGAIVIVGGALILRSRRKKLEKKIAEGSEDILAPAALTTTSVIFPLKKGYGINTEEKNAVKVVQRYINAKSEAGIIKLVPLAEDGIFGPLTESALYALAGVKEVSYSYYREMYNFLNKVPQYLSKDTGPYTGSSTDPSIQKNSLDSLYLSIMHNYE